MKPQSSTQAFRALTGVTRVARTPTRSYSPPLSDSTRQYAPLANRSVLELSGPDAQKFLKGLSSRDVERLGGGYSGFLNASGRVLHTVFILPVSAKIPTYLVISHSQNPHDLVTLLPPFKLRSKVKIRDVSEEWDVYSAWGSDPALGTNDSSPEYDPSAPPAHHPIRHFKFGSGGAAEAQWSWPEEIAPLGLADKEHGCWDLRVGFGALGLGKQVLVPKGAKPSLSADFDQVDANSYDLRRMTLGVPEGPNEIIPGTALPLESCMDIHGGVDFRKGCYLGQELTVRTYHTGATRKRVLPLVVRGQGTPPPGSDITYTPPSTSASKKGRSAGKLLSTHSTATHLGLGLIRLEMAEKSCWLPPQEELGKLTITHEGNEWQVQAQQGEAYGSALVQQREDEDSSQRQEPR